ncbi:MAG: YcjX family protein [Hyphomicrobiaceae bacterium]
MRAVDILPDTADALRAANSYVAGLMTPVIRLGVTGLARSGKTVFITALVRNLVAGGRLPYFEANAEGRILRAYLEPQPDDAIPRFEYENHLASLNAEVPVWPESTRRISQLRLTIAYQSNLAVWRWMGPSRVHIDIVDYPGEWLLDLALADQSYESWATDALSLARTPQRAGAATEFLTFLDGVEPGALGDEQRAIRGAKLYTAYLHADRASDQAQATLGPGRFLMPGELEGSPLLTFFPMEPVAEGAKSGTLYALMVRRFESYKANVVQPFFRDHFSKLDRQIVLIDVLGAINRGGGAVADLERALTSVMRAFRPGAGSWLSFITGARIDKLLFCATKADHLHHGSHDRLEAILRHATERASGRASAAGAGVGVLAISAVRATREAEVREGKETFAVIMGVPLPGERLDGQTFDGKAEVGVFPGDLPLDPAAAFASDGVRAGEQAFVRFRPPRVVAMPGTTGAVLPHIRLDRAIEFLIGDKLA